MNAYAIFAVNEHLEFLLEEAARNRMPKHQKPGLRSRIASAVDKVRSSVAGSTFETGSILPDARRLSLPELSLLPRLPASSLQARQTSASSAGGGLRVSGAG